MKAVARARVVAREVARVVARAEERAVVRACVCVNLTSSALNLSPPASGLSSPKGRAPRCYC